MTLPKQADDYLKQVRQGLASLGQDEREEIVAELRSHLLDRQAQGKTDLLDGFDTAERFAAAFVTESALRSALAQGTSWALGRALLMAARDSALLLFGLLPLLLAQLIAVGFMVCAALKPFFQDQLGLWVGPHAFFIGTTTGTATDIHQVTGWWVFPAVAVAGVILFWLSTRLMMSLVRWRLRRPDKKSQP
jgi:uncharacterized membrane protein